MLTTFNITQQGEYHIKRNLPCQDYSKTVRIHPEHLDTDLVIAAVSDGVGSCIYSQDGSRESVEASVRFIVDGLENENAVIDDEYISDLLRESFETAYDAVLVYADEHEHSFAQMDSTLTVTVYDGTTVWFGHVGDDGIVAMYTDGSYELITQRHKGEFASSVFPLRETHKWQFGQSQKPVASFALMTDGVLDYVVGSDFFDNRVFYPFIQPILADAMDDDEKMEHLKTEFEAYLKDDPEAPSGFRKHVTDDISLAVVQNCEAVHSLPEINFDMDEWDRQTEEYNKKAQEYLYKEFNQCLIARSEKKHERIEVEVDAEDDSAGSDGLTILKTDDGEKEKNNGDISPGSPVTDNDVKDSYTEVQDAAQQVVKDIVSAGKGLRKFLKSTIDLGSAIINSRNDDAD